MKEIKDTVGFAIVKVARAHRQRAEEALNKLGLHTGQEVLLMQLWQEEGLTQAQLAEALGIEAPTVTKMLNRLTATGLIERRQDVEDGRLSRVFLTEQGRALKEPVMQVWAKLDERTLRGLTDREQDLLRSLLLQIADNLSDGKITDNC